MSLVKSDNAGAAISDLQTLFVRSALPEEEASSRSFGTAVRGANRQLVRNILALPELMESRLVGRDTPAGALQALSDAHDICQDFLPENIGDVAKVVAVSGIHPHYQEDSEALARALIDSIGEIVERGAKIGRQLAQRHSDNSDVAQAATRLIALCDERRTQVEQARDGEAMAIARRFYATSVVLDMCNSLRDPRLHNALIAALDDPKSAAEQADAMLAVAREDDIPESARDLMSNDPPFQSMRIKAARQALACITHALKVFDDGSAGHGRLMADFYDRVSQMDALEQAHQHLEQVHQQAPSPAPAPASRPAPETAAQISGPAV